MITLNEFVFIAFILGTAVNYLTDHWIWDTKTVIANFLVVLVAWLVTQYFIPIEPTVLWTKFIYIVGCLVVGFSPVAVIKVLTGKGFEVFKGWAEKKSAELIQKKTETTETTTKIETTEKKEG